VHSYPTGPGLRCIACLYDLERELVAMLRSFCFKPIRAAAAGAGAGISSMLANPEEIELHSDDDDNKVGPRGLHSSTLQLNLSASCVSGGAVRVMSGVFNRW